MLPACYNVLTVIVMGANAKFRLKQQKQSACDASGQEIWPRWAKQVVAITTIRQHISLVTCCKLKSHLQHNDTKLAASNSTSWLLQGSGGDITDVTRNCLSWLQSRKVLLPLAHGYGMYRHMLVLAVETLQRVYRAVELVPCMLASTAKPAL